MGPPKFSDASLPACHSLRTSADFHMLALTHASCWLRVTLRPSPSATNSFRSCTSFQGTRLPLRPAGFSVYASPTLFASYLPPDSAAGATLDTGGWLALTRPGLSPGKIRQAYLGATTLRFSGGPRSGPSAAPGCSAARPAPPLGGGAHMQSIPFGPIVSTAEHRAVLGDTPSAARTERCASLRTHAATAAVASGGFIIS
jgi:hypothetical protein